MKRKEMVTERESQRLKLGTAHGLEPPPLCRGTNLPVTMLLLALAVLGAAASQSGQHHLVYVRFCG